MRNRRRNVVLGGRPFHPTQVAALGAWLTTDGATSDANGYSSVPFYTVSGGVATPGTPATQSVNAQKPQVATSGNGLSIMRFTNDVLSLPLVSAINGSVKFAMACWVRCNGVASTGDLFAVNTTAGGASASRIRFGRIAGDIYAQVYVNDSSARRARSPGTLLVNATWQFIGIEYDGSQSAEADECQLLLDTAVIASLTFSNAVGTPGDMPDTLVQPTGNALIGANTTAGAQPWVGDVGPDIWFYDPALITTADLTSLMHYRMPVG